jgi:hypothetical protein
MPVIQAMGRFPQGQYLSMGRGVLISLPAVGGFGQNDILRANHDSTNGDISGSSSGFGYF